MRTFAMVCVVAVLSSLCLAQDAKPRAAEASPPYGPVGAPLNPKVDARWNRYHDYAEATAILKQLAEAHPQRLKLTSLGKSYGEREMWLVTVTDFEDGDAASKPAFWIDGGIHANEIQGPEAVLYTAWFLCEMAGQNELMDRLLNERVFYMVPMMSPDARDAHMHEAATTHSPRGGLRPYDNDHDGLEDEDGPDDLDGDGHITTMRIADPNGLVKAHPKYPQLMVRVEPDEEEVDQRYRILGPEGIDNDGDGRVNEDPPGGYDPNRDWPWSWQPGYVQGGALKYPLWIEENRVVAQFIIDHPNIAGAQSYHNAGGMILRGPGVKGEQLERGDLAVFTAIGKRGEMMLPGYRYLHLAEDLYPAFGAEIDWFYGMRGVTAYTNEMFTAFNYFRKTVEQGVFFGTEEDQFAFEKYLLLGEGLVKWHEVEHPIYGTIEVGGTKKNWLRQPPSFLLEEELHRNMAFTLYHADQLPLVSLQSVTAKEIGGLWQVDAIVANERLQPTRLGVDIKRKITVPDRVAISGENVKVIAGLTSDEPFFLRPDEQEHHPQQMHIDTIEGHSVVYVRWLVSGKPPFEISVQSVKGGGDRMAVMGGGM